VQRLKNNLKNLFKRGFLFQMWLLLKDPVREWSEKCLRRSNRQKYFSCHKWCLYNGEYKRLTLGSCCCCPKEKRILIQVACILLSCYHSSWIKYSLKQRNVSLDGITYLEDFFSFCFKGSRMSHLHETTPFQFIKASSEEIPLLNN